MGTRRAPPRDIDRGIDTGLRGVARNSCNAGRIVARVRGGVGKSIFCMQGQKAPSTHIHPAAGPGQASGNGAGARRTRSKAPHGKRTDAFRPGRSRAPQSLSLNKPTRHLAAIGKDLGVSSPGHIASPGAGPQALPHGKAARRPHTQTHGTGGRSRVRGALGHARASRLARDLQKLRAVGLLHRGLRVCRVLLEIGHARSARAGAAPSSASEDELA